MSRKQDRECPICGEMFSGQGLHGHLRMAHGVSADDLDEEKREDREVMSLTEKTERTFTLIDRLKECREKRKEIEEADRTGLIFRDDSAKEALEALDALESEIRAKLKEIGADEEQLALTEE